MSQALYLGVKRPMDACVLVYTFDHSCLSFNTVRTRLTASMSFHFYLLLITTKWPPCLHFHQRNPHVYFNTKLKEIFLATSFSIGQPEVSYQEKYNCRLALKASNSKGPSACNSFLISSAADENFLAWTALPGMQGRQDCIFVYSFRVV